MRIDKRKEFNNVRPFDIIWAKRDIEENEAFDDERGYEGSYIVINRDKDKLYCLRGGQKIKDYYDPYIVFSRLIKNKNRNEKIVYYINIDIKEIDYDKFINKKTRLNVEEKRDLIDDIKKQGNLVDYKIYDMDLSIKTGDIIKKDNKLYFVIYKYGEKLQCLEIKDDNNLENCIYIDDIKYINYNEIKEFNINDNIKYVNKISRELFGEIFNNFKELNYGFVNYFNKLRNVCVGLLIELNNNLYYVHKVEESNMRCYLINDYDEINGNVVIDNKRFISDFEEYIIAIKENFKPIIIANNEEIKNINNLFICKNKTKKLLK